MGIFEQDEVDEETQKLYRSWGDYLTDKNLFSLANEYYRKYLENENNDAQAFYNRSICLREFAKSEDAVKDAKAAINLIPYRVDFNLQVSEALFDTNDFENCKIELHASRRKFERVPKKFDNRLDILNENYSDSLGNKYAIFTKNNNIVKIFEDMKENDDIIDISDRPLWKILKEREKCDVVSILEKKEEILHPREIERRKLCYKTFTQLYFHKGSKDLQFLTELSNNKTFLLPQTTKSTRKLKSLLYDNYEVSSKFLKMLQARNPVYTQKFTTGRDHLLAEREKEYHILRLQYKTRRDMFNILKKMNNLRSQGKLEELSKAVYYFLTEYVILKTNKVMPRKFEFINEVCNILALAYIDRLDIPIDIMQIYDPMLRLQHLFDVPVIKEKEYSEFVIGDKTTFKDPEAKDPCYILYKKRISILEKRSLFAKYPIEKCYLYHEIGLSHLRQSKHDMCLTITNKIIEEAEKCKNRAWKVLGYYLICKTLSAQSRLERLNEVLHKAIPKIQKLKNKKLNQFFQLTYKLTVLTLKQQKKSKMSYY